MEPFIVQNDTRVGDISRILIEDENQQQQQSYGPISEENVPMNEALQIPHTQTELPVFNDKPEMAQLSALFYTFNNKFYNCGFVYKLNALGSSGNPLFRNTAPEVQLQADGYWSKWWVEQWGSVLHLWRVPDELASFGYTANIGVDRFIKNEQDPPMNLMAAIKSFQSVPLFINIADSFNELFQENFQNVGFQDTPAPPIPYTCFFGVSTAASNLYLFASPSMIQANQWIASIRLALYEDHKLNKIFTNRWLRKPSLMQSWKELGVEPFTSQTFRGEIKYEGPLQIRIPYSSIWKQYHVVVTSKYSSEAYAVNTGISNKIFKKKASTVDFSKRGSILFYQTKSSAEKGKPPLFSIYDVKWATSIWPDKNDEFKLETICLAKIEGKFKLHSLKTTGNEMGDIKRTFEIFANGFPSITGMESLVNIVEGRDIRPLPHEILIMAQNSWELAQCITSILCAFGIDSGLEQGEEEIKEMTRTLDPVEGEIQPDLIPVLWPTQLFMSISEIGGISMPSYSILDTFMQYEHYLLQKLTFSKQDKLRQWCESTAKGEWERNLYDRKELEYKIKQIFDWVVNICKKLNSQGIETEKPSPAILIPALSSIVSWIGPVLQSMIDPISSPTKSSPTKFIASGSTASGSLKFSKSKASKASTKTESTDGEGSVSEEERSDEGSQSDEESELSSHLSHQGYDQDMHRDYDKDYASSISESPDEFHVYAPNSLLAQVAETEKEPKITHKSNGPFINTQGHVPNTAQIGDKLLLAKPLDNNRSSAFFNIQPNRASAYITGIESKQRAEEMNFNDQGLVQKIGQSTVKKNPTSGPLLGSLDELEKKKPKLEGGLLGEMDRRAKEVQYLKKMGLYKNSIGAAGLINLPHLTPGESSLDSYNRDLYRQQMLTQERIQTGHAFNDLREPLSKINGLIQQMSNVLILSQQTNPILVQNLQKLLSQMSIFMGQLNNHIFSPSNTPSNAGFTPNPFAIPNITWKQASSVSSSSRSRGPSSKTSSYASSEYDSDGSKLESSSYKSSSGTESLRSASNRTNSTEASNLDDDTPLSKFKHSPSKQSPFSGSSGTGISSASSKSHSLRSSTEAGSESDSSSEENEVPLGLLANGVESTHFKSSGVNRTSTDQIPLTFFHTNTASVTKSNYQNYLMGQQNKFAMHNYENIPQTRTISSNPSSYPSILQKKSISPSTSATSTPKATRKPQPSQAESSEGSVSDESD